MDSNYFLLTFDVEDWFQVENLKSCIPFSSWGSCELRVEKNVHQILDLLDTVFTPLASRLTTHANQNSQVASRKSQGDPLPRPPALPPSRPHATFFVLGWIAERFPHLVREIVQRGHEVASHGYGHQLCHLCSPESLKEDLVKSKNLLEDLIGSPINGYRAPSFSVNPGVIDVLQETGYRYDSSFNSFGINSRYGKLNLGINGIKGIAHPLSNGFYELPVSNFMLGNKVVPLGGGGYFRLIPLPIFGRGVRAIMDKKSAYLFYLHPWELDPGQPRVEGASRLSRFRHYHNLNKTAARLSKLITAFNDCRFVTCSQYLDEITQRGEAGGLRQEAGGKRPQAQRSSRLTTYEYNKEPFYEH